MAKIASELNRKVLQNIRTQRTDDYIRTALQDTVAMGEIAVQLGSGATVGESEKNTGLWVLAADGVTAVRFASQKWITDKIDEITGSASTQTEVIDNIIESVGLQSTGDDKGSTPSNWNTGTTYVSASTNVLDAIKDLDKAIKDIDDSIVDELEVTGVTDSTDKVLVDLKQHEGLIGTATTKHVGEFTLAGYTGGTDTKIAESQKLNTALGNLQAQIDAMDKAADAKTGHVVTTVAQEDGKVTETKELLTNIVLSGYNGDHGTVTSADTLGQAIDKIEDEIAAAVNAVTVASSDNSITVTTGANGTDIVVNVKTNDPILSTDGDNGIFSTLNLVKITTGLPETVKERYELQGINGAKIGDDIDIAKDSHIVSITYISDPADAHYQNLEYKYIDASGATKTEYVDMTNLVFESEFKSGVTATNGIVHGVVDPQSETFLTVGADGFKLSGVQAAIDAAKASGKTEINTTVGGDATNTHMGISATTAADGHTIYEFGLYDVASAKELANLSGSVLSLDATVTGETAHVGITIVEENGKLTTVALTETDIASASALTAEIARAKAAETALDGVIGSSKNGTGETRTYSHTTTNYLNGNNSVKKDVEAIDAILGNTGNGTTGTTFGTGNTVADVIDEIKKEIADAKSALTVTATDDDKYIAATATTTEIGTTINVVAVTGSVVDATSAESALVDSWDAKQNFVHELVDNTVESERLSDWNVTKTAANDSNKGVVYDFTKLCVDCGEF